MGGCHVVKFSDGTCLAFAKTRLVTDSVSTAWGSGFHNRCKALDLPKVFASIEGATASSTGSSLWSVAGMSATKDYVSFYVSSFTVRGANEELPAFVIASGAWK